MLSAWVILMLQTLFFPLRLSGSVSSFPRALKPEEERACLERYAAGDLTARDELIEHNLRLVAHIVKKYYNQTGDQDDLISIGTIGLIKGVTTFKPDRNVRLSTYVSRCVENEILMYFRNQRKIQGEVSLSDTLDAEGEPGSLSLMDVLKVDDTMLEDLSIRDAGAAVRRSVESCLDSREREVIELRYGLSRSYVSRIEKKALEKLRAELEEAWSA